MSQSQPIDASTPPAVPPTAEAGINVGLDTATGSIVLAFGPSAYFLTPSVALTVAAMITQSAAARIASLEAPQSSLMLPPSARRRPPFVRVGDAPSGKW